MRQPLPKHSESPVAVPLYSPAERARRDASLWTSVQGVLAAVQFLIFLGSCALVWRYLATGDGASAATASVVAKTLALYAIMITGSLWERDVFGQYLFAPAFFWEDAVSMVVIALHTAYLATWLFDLLPLREQFALALCAYATYVINAGQFLIKFRRARLHSGATSTGLAEMRA
jgi:3-vinyl bacteriochlorophyllide hydratase